MVDKSVEGRIDQRESRDMNDLWTDPKARETLCIKVHRRGEMRTPAATDMCLFV